jgi:PAS domain S-box-containing protein
MRDFLSGGGEMGALMRAHDWSESCLGPAVTWPLTLRMAVRLMLNAAHPMCVCWGPDSACLYNDAWRRSIGPQNQPASPGRPAREQREMWSIIGPRIARVMTGGGAIWHENQFVPMTRHGRREDTWWNFGFTQIDDDSFSHGIGGVLVICNETTEQVLAEAALHERNATLEARAAERTERLRASENLIQTFFRHSSECHAVLVGDDAGQFRYEEINPATLLLYGKTRDQVIGFTTAEVVGVENSVGLDRHMAASLRSGAPYRYERRQGEGVVEAVATPVPGEAGFGRRVVVSARDVTERRRLEEQLRQAQKMEAVGQLTGGVAHDFNNLLTLVMGGLEIIGRQLPQLRDTATAERIARARDMAMHGVQRAVALTSRLLAFSRQQPLAPQVLDANKLVAGICDLLRRSLGEAVSLETVLAGGLWRTYADPNQLENALLNLALNARDAMPDGGKLTIETANASLDEVYVASLTEPVTPGQYVMIAVADTGSGMDRATLARAFDPFFTTKEVGKGTGLGLSQVYGFTRQSAGHIKIYSEIGEGTTVKIYLPRRIGTTNEAISAAPPDAARAIGEETILAVEDDKDLRAYTAEILRELGYRVIEAANGVAALEILGREEKLDLLLTDVVMPGGMNGRQLADAAAAIRPELRVLFMTGYTRNAIVHHGRLDAGIHLISKPFSFQELAARVRARLDGPA